MQGTSRGLENLRTRFSLQREIIAPALMRGNRGAFQARDVSLGELSLRK